MSTKEEEALQKLREIFFAERNNREVEFEREIESIKFRLNNKEAKIEAYYPIITEILEKKISTSKAEVAQALAPILGTALKTQIEESKDDIIDVLYPIMGEIIKKKVSESVKDIYNSLNKKIDNALKRGVFSKQVKSKLTGVSTNDLIFQESFPFSVQEIFLIHEESGILMEHVSADSANTNDADLVSGMLTAIKDFVRESFKTISGNQNLYEIQYGDSKILLERGRYSYLAIVIRGQEPPEFDKELTDFNLELHKKFTNKLKKFNGNVGELKGIENYLKSFITKFTYSEKVIEEKPKPVLLYLLLIIFFIGLLIWGAFTIPQYLRDKTIAEQVTKKLEKIENIDLKEINLSSKDNILKVNGFVKSYKQKNIVDSIVYSVPNIKEIDNNLGVLFFETNEQVINSKIESLLLRNRFNKITYLIENNKVTLSGLIASNEDKIIFADKVSQIEGVRVVINNIEVLGNNFLETIKNLRLNFGFNKVILLQKHLAKLDMLVKNKIPLNKRLIIIGASDGNANAKNLNIANKRAENVKEYLVANGFNEQSIRVISEIENSRIVRFEIEDIK